MRGHSLTSILCKVVDCEIKEQSHQRDKIARQSIKRGCGLRQGMPLSPILSNLALSKFDAAVRKQKLIMVRYADDLIFFFKTEDEMLAGEQFIRSELAKYELSIPINGKTQRIKPRASVEFLGREIFHSEIDGYHARVSDKQIKKIVEHLHQEYSLRKRIIEKSNFQETVVQLARSVSSYLGIYRDAHNFKHFENQLRAEFRKILSQFFMDILGRDALTKLTNENRNFLGIGHLDIPSAVNDLGL
jgi:hypothetical protein